MDKRRAFTFIELLDTEIMYNGSILLSPNKWHFPPLWHFTPPPHNEYIQRTSPIGNDAQAERWPIATTTRLFFETSPGIIPVFAVWHRICILIM